MKSVKKHSQFQRIALLSLSFLLFFSLQANAQEGDSGNGKSLFNANCAACHKLDKKLIGPALGGVSERRSREWLQAWIHDNQALIKSGDAEAIAIFEEFNKSPMQAFPQLSEQDVDDIIAYTDGKPALAAASSSAAPVASADEAAIAEGESLFKMNCAACHKWDKKLVGPALGKVGQRREMDWLIAWIKDNNALRASGDADAIAIYEEYNGSVMSAFPQLSDQQIKNIVLYLDQEPKAKTASVATTDYVEEPASTEWMTYTVVVFLIGLALWVYLKSDNGFLKIVTTIALLFLTAYVGFGAMMAVGVDQGYQPIQPIAFSHKIHAGQNNVDCQYCHSTAKHSKHSGIPSANVCMNCHKAIAEYNGPVTEELTKEFYDGEIQKLYTAVGWDPEKFEYTGEEQPIEWVRIHNLPDFAYFNHAQHVTVGGQKCQTCHGPIQEMEEVYQFAPLTMGWCIDCHSNTDVKLKDNDYYKNIHEQLANKFGVEKVTVAQMGGKECGKCHY